MNDDDLVFEYRNWRDEVSIRRVKPIRIWFGSTEWHSEKQWFMEADDLYKGERRDFAVTAIIRFFPDGIDPPGKDAP